MEHAQVYDWFGSYAEWIIYSDHHKNIFFLNTWYQLFLFTVWL